MASKRLSGTVIAGGGGVKALDPSGKIGGYMIVFGGEDKSKWRDRFLPPPGTDYGRHIKGGLDLIYHHGLPTVEGKANPFLDGEIGEVKAEADARGMKVEGSMSLATSDHRQLFDEIRAGRHGFSSGAVGHLVRRDPQPDGTHVVKKWHAAECSVTPSPAEPRAEAYAIKSIRALAGLTPAEAEEVAELQADIRRLQARRDLLAEEERAAESEVKARRAAEFGELAGILPDDYAAQVAPTIRGQWLASLKYEHRLGTSPASIKSMANHYLTR